jgi:hypothetical protein
MEKTKLNSTTKKQTYKNVVFFEETFHIRIKAEDKIKINKVVDKNQDIFFNDSHFIRCALIRLLRDFDDKGRKIK